MPTSDPQVLDYTVIDIIIAGTCSTIVGFGFQNNRGIERGKRPRLFNFQFFSDFRLRTKEERNLRFSLSAHSSSSKQRLGLVQGCSAAEARERVANFALGVHGDQRMPLSSAACHWHRSSSRRACEATAVLLKIRKEKLHTPSIIVMFLLVRTTAIQRTRKTAIDYSASGLLRLV